MFVSTLIVFFLILIFLVLVHELGHFFAARKLGIGVEEFGIGFPPRIASWVKNGMTWSINLIPLGGFVKIKGEDNGEPKDPDSFSSRPAWQRLIVLVSGVSMNVLAGWLILIILFATGAPMAISQDIKEEYIKERSIYIEEVLAESPAYFSGIEPGDKILEANGTPIENIEQFQEITSSRHDEETEIIYERKGSKNSTLITPKIMEEIQTDRAIIGISLIEAGVVRFPLHKAFWQGTLASVNYLKRIGSAFGSIFTSLFRGKGVELGGPVAIAVETDNAVKLGFPYILVFTAILSFNLAIINIFPFPALDGGRIVFIIVEKIRGKPSKAEVEAWLHQIGFGLLILLIIFVTYKDFMRFGGRIWQALTG